METDLLFGAVAIYLISQDGERNHGKPVVPSSQRRGGRDLKQISPKASIVRSGRGGQSISDHPVCAFKGSFAIFFDAQPPLLS